MNFGSKIEAVKPLDRNQLTVLLCEGSLDYQSVTNLTKHGQELANQQIVKPLTWNENSGVIIFSDAEGATFVTHASDKNRKELLKSKDYSKDENLGVPNLNDGQEWTSKEAFEDWKNSGV